jgi:hypothetical protein
MLKTPFLMSVKSAIILVILAMLTCASAETLPCGNYTASFDVKQTHIIDGSKIKTFDGWISVLEYKNIGRDSAVLISEINVSGMPAKIGFFTDRSGYQVLMEKCPIVVLSTMNLTSTMKFLDSLRIRKKV